MAQRSGKVCLRAIFLNAPVPVLEGKSSKAFHIPGTEGALGPPPLSTCPSLSPPELPTSSIPVRVRVARNPNLSLDAYAHFLSPSRARRPRPTTGLHLGLPSGLPRKPSNSTPFPPSSSSSLASSLASSLLDSQPSLSSQLSKLLVSSPEDTSISSIILNIWDS